MGFANAAEDGHNLRPDFEFATRDAKIVIIEGYTEKLKCQDMTLDGLYGDVRSSNETRDLGSGSHNILVSQRNLGPLPMGMRFSIVERRAVP